MLGNWKEETSTWGWDRKFGDVGSGGSSGTRGHSASAQGWLRTPFRRFHDVRAASLGLEVRRGFQEGGFGVGGGGYFFVGDDDAN